MVWAHWPGPSWEMSFCSWGSQGKSRGRKEKLPSEHWDTPGPPVSPLPSLIHKCSLGMSLLAGLRPPGLEVTTRMSNEMYRLGPRSPDPKADPASCVLLAPLRPRQP